MQRDGPPRDRESQAAAGCVAVSRLLGAVEALEDIFAVCRRERRRLVENPHLHGVGPPGDADRDRPGRGRELDRVLEQVRHDLSEEALVAAILDAARRLDLDGDVPAGSEHAKGSADFLGQLLQVDQAPFQRMVQRLALGEEGQVADDQRQALAFGGDRSQGVTVGRRAALRREGELRLGANDGHRRLQLMGGVGDESLELTHRRGDPLEEPVERPGEAAQFVCGSDDRERLKFRR